MKNNNLTEQILTSQNTGNFFNYISDILPDPDKIFQEKGYDFDFFRELIKEPFFDGVWEKRVANIVRNNYYIIPQDESSTQKEIVSFFEDWLDKQNLHSIFSGFLEAVLFGYSVTEILWKSENNKWCPDKLDTKPQEWTGFKKSGELQLKKGYNSFIDAPPFKFLVAKHYPTYTNPYGKKLVSILFWRFVFLKGGWRFFTIFVEKFGGATAWAKIPENKYEDDIFKDKVLEALDILCSGGVGVVPDGVEIDYKEATGKSDTATLYKEYIDELKKDIAICILGEQLTSIQSETGTRAATEVHNEVRKEKSDIDMSIIEPCINELIKYYSYLNYGIDTSPIFLFTRPTSLNFELAERDKLLKETYNIDFSEEYIREKYGLNEEDFVKVALQPESGVWSVESGLSRGSSSTPLSTLNTPNSNKWLLKQFKKEDKKVSSDEKIIQEFLEKKGEEFQKEFDKIVDTIIDNIEDISDTGVIFEQIANTYPDLDFDSLCDVMGEVLYVAKECGVWSVKSGVSRGSSLTPHSTLHSLLSVIKNIFNWKKKTKNNSTLHSLRSSHFTLNKVVNQDALAFLKEKKVIPSEEWDDFWQGEHSHIFTVAHSHTCNFLEKIHSYCDAMIEKGLSLDIFKNGLKKHCEKNGWYGGREAPTIKEGDSEEVKKEKQEKYLNWRLETIAKTNCRAAYMAGKYTEMVKGAKLRPVWVYEAVMDGATRAKHKELNNKAFWYDHPFWDTYFPPNDWGCRCSVISLTESAATKRGLTVIKSDQEVKIRDDFAPKEWQYNVAREKWSPDWSKYAYGKQILQQKIIGVVKDKWMSDLKKNVMPKKDYDEWIENVIKAPFPKGETKQINIIDPNIVNKIEKDKKVEIDPRIYITDKSVWHTIRDAKDPKIKVGEKELKDMYKIVNKPDMVIYDIGKDKLEAFLFIKYNNKNDMKGGVIKYVFKRKNKNSCLTLFTASKIEDTTGIDIKNINKVLYQK